MINFIHVVRYQLECDKLFLGVIKVYQYGNMDLTVCGTSLVHVVLCFIVRFHRNLVCINTSVVLTGVRLGVIQIPHQLQHTNFTTLNTTVLDVNIDKPNAKKLLKFLDQLYLISVYYGT